MAKELHCALDLDNIRCFLFGVGSKDRFEDANSYETPALSAPKSEKDAAGVKDRIAFFNAFFASTVIVERLKVEKDCYGKGNKEITEFVKDLCGNEGKRGCGGYLDYVSDYLAKHNNSVNVISQHTKSFLENWNTDGLSRNLLGFVDRVMPVEAKNTDSVDLKRKTLHSNVFYILVLIRDQVVANICGDNSLEDTARILTILSLVALLRDKFPLRLLKETIDHQYSALQLYHIGNVMIGVLQNAASISHQIDTQKRFIGEIRRQYADTANGLFEYKDFQENPAKSAFSYSENIGFELAKVRLQLDYSDIEAICEAHHLHMTNAFMRFIHNAAFHMDTLATEGMKQILRYIELYKDKPDSIADRVTSLCDSYSKFLNDFKNLVFWALTYIHTEIPTGSDPDMELIIRTFSDGSDRTALIYMPQNLNELQRMVSDAEDKAKRSVRDIQNKDVKIVFPEVFYRAKLIEDIGSFQAEQETQVRCVSGYEGVPPYESITRLFFGQIKLADTLFGSHKLMLEYLSALSYDLLGTLSPERIDAIKKRISQYREAILNYIQSPDLLFTEPLVTDLYKTGINYIELQVYFLSIKCAVAEFDKYVHFLTESLPMRKELESTYQQHLNNAKDDLEDQTAFISSGINCFFADWKSDALELVKKKTGELEIITADFDSWADSKSKAEALLNAQLDDAENGIFGLDAKLANDQWELLEIKRKLDNARGSS